MKNLFSTLALTCLLLGAVSVQAQQVRIWEKSPRDDAFSIYQKEAEAKGVRGLNSAGEVPLMSMLQLIKVKAIEKGYLTESSSEEEVKAYFGKFINLMGLTDGNGQTRLTFTRHEFNSVSENPGWWVPVTELNPQATQPGVQEEVAELPVVPEDPIVVANRRIDSIQFAMQQLNQQTDLNAADANRYREMILSKLEDLTTEDKRLGASITNLSEEFKLAITGQNERLSILEDKDVHQDGRITELAETQANQAKVDARQDQAAGALSEFAGSVVEYMEADQKVADGLAEELSQHKSDTGVEIEKLQKANLPFGYQSMGESLPESVTGWYATYYLWVYAVVALMTMALVAWSVNLPARRRLALIGVENTSRRQVEPDRVKPVAMATVTSIPTRRTTHVDKPDLGSEVMVGVTATVPVEAPIQPGDFNLKGDGSAKDYINPERVVPVSEEQDIVLPPEEQSTVALSERMQDCVRSAKQA